MKSTQLAHQLVSDWLEGGDVVAVARALMPSDALANTRREKHAVKTERVFVRG